jgi:acetyltransferase-like isoleucine patch superfamily enzyme
LIDPHVRIDSGSCTFGEGVIICAGSIVTVNVKFEPFSMVNIGSVIAHESVIGAYGVVNQLANICGGVVLGKGVLVGSGARVLQYLTVGEDAAVGAGAVVTKDVEPGVTVVGIPARPLCKTARHSN